MATEAVRFDKVFNPISPDSPDENPLKRKRSASKRQVDVLPSSRSVGDKNMVMSGTIKQDIEAFMSQTTNKLDQIVAKVTSMDERLGNLERKFGQGTVSVMQSQSSSVISSTFLSKVSPVTQPSMPRPSPYSTPATTSNFLFHQPQANDGTTLKRQRVTGPPAQHSLTSPQNQNSSLSSQPPAIPKINAAMGQTTKDAQSSASSREILEKVVSSALSDLTNDSSPVFGLLGLETSLDAFGADGFFSNPRPSSNAPSVRVQPVSLPLSSSSSVTSSRGGQDQTSRISNQLKGFRSEFEKHSAVSDCTLAWVKSISSGNLDDLNKAIELVSDKIQKFPKTKNLYEIRSQLYLNKYQITQDLSFRQLSKDDDGQVQDMVFFESLS